jgi:hypothetical protein
MTKKLWIGSGLLFCLLAVSLGVVWNWSALQDGEEAKSARLETTPYSSPQGLALSPVQEEQLKEALLWTLATEPYETTLTETGLRFAWLTTYGIASGVFDQVEHTLPSGKTVTLDLTYMYHLTAARHLQKVPIVIGMRTRAGRYAYFSDRYYNEAGSTAAMRITRPLALEHARTHLASGTQIRLTAYQNVIPDGLIWADCASYLVDFRQMPAEICQLGTMLEAQYPGLTRLFLHQAVPELPSGWMLAGWFFFNPDLPLVEMGANQETNHE